MDLDRVMASLRGAAACLMAERAEVDRVLLFGSLVRGNYGARSDADVAVILKDSPFSVWFQRIPSLLTYFADCAVPVDLFPYTLAELDRAASQSFFAALLQGEVLASR
ncbi:MAG: nucleotidyltransferase domain-containing protein [Candidatus Xenobia bacterium]